MSQRYAKVKIAGRTYSVHRLVAAHMLGRPLTPGEVVHHKNGDRFDNHPSNLEVLTHRERAVHHNQKHDRAKSCASCGRVYEPAPTKRGRSKTCSRECFRGFMSRWATARYAGEAK
jgi:hypothetical protein